MNSLTHLLIDTLFVQEQGTYLGLNAGRVEVRNGTSVLHSFPCNWIKQIVLIGRCTLTSGMIEHCIQKNIPVIFLSVHGRFRGRLHSHPVPSLPLIQRQWKLYRDGERRLLQAREMVRAKLNNQRQLLLRKNKHRKSHSLVLHADVLLQMQNRINENTTLEALRGYEGRGAVAFFEGIVELIPPELRFSQRNKRPPKDPVNALLSFGYTLLFQFIESLILAHGLHPGLGCLHRKSTRYSCLAADLMEEFRSPVVDLLVLNLIGLNRLKKTDFIWKPESNEGCFLKPEGRKLFLQEFSKQFMKRFPHPASKEPVSLAACITRQVRLYKELLWNPEAQYKAFFWPIGF
ncbi:MAG: CRISPR-associated endonuclease Cas1 [Candidatus Omnitrophica bacterium]|nr:CRISPR-associated endonuclease Cas1 [Candidatus Omnitrophota bacterium]HPP02656.1 CRISPR-associated endonuclease Cas1 [bacterium]